jgi:glycerophosphoryl diester phosphodiesterase
MRALHYLGWLALVAPAFAAVSRRHDHGHGKVKRISLGPRPYWLIEQMDEGPLKDRLASCSEKEMKRSDWSISHRGGGTLQFPEHTYDSIMAGVSLLPSPNTA